LINLDLTIRENTERFGRVFPLTESGTFKRRSCRRSVAGGRGKRELGQGENYNRERRLDGSERGVDDGDGGAVELVRCMQGWHADCPNLKAVRGDGSPHLWQAGNHRFWGLEQRYHSLVPSLSSPIEWCFAILI